MRALAPVLIAPLVLSSLACSPKKEEPGDAPAGARFAIGGAKTSDPEPEESEATPGLGVGQPDETNGVCRLFSKEYNEPICCPRTYGLGAAEVEQICGDVALLGEHLRDGCGYFFLHAESGEVQWLRVAFIAENLPPAKAVEMRDAYLKKRTRDPEFASTPIPGVEGGAYNVVDGLGWALLPGWGRLRQAAWSEGFCGDQLPALLESIATAPEPTAETPAFRDGLLPSRAPVQRPPSPVNGERPLG